MPENSMLFFLPSVYLHVYVFVYLCICAVQWSLPPFCQFPGSPAWQRRCVTADMISSQILYTQREGSRDAQYDRNTQNLKHTNMISFHFFLQFLRQISVCRPSSSHISDVLLTVPGPSSIPFSLQVVALYLYLCVRVYLCYTAVWQRGWSLVVADMICPASEEIKGAASWDGVIWQERPRGHFYLTLLGIL